MHSSRVFAKTGSFALVFKFSCDQQKMAIPYETAIETIQAVFNNNIEKDVVSAVLEANNGHMERTIECLLNMFGELSPEEATVIVSLLYVLCFKNFHIGHQYWKTKTDYGRCNVRKDVTWSTVYARIKKCTRIQSNF